MAAESPASITYGYTIVYVPNVTAALDFYGEAFGLERKFVHDSEMYAELDTGATKLAFADEKFAPTVGAFSPNRRETQPPGFEIAFVVADVQASFRRAVDAGASELAAPEQKPWGQIVAYVRDLNGVLVELCTAVRR